MFCEVSELAEPLVVEGYCPVFGQELGDVGDEETGVALFELVQILLVDSDELNEGLQLNLLGSEVGDVFDDSVGVDGEVQVVALSLEVVGCDFLLTVVFLIEDLGPCMFIFFNVVVIDVFGDDSAEANRHVKFGQFLYRT